VKTLALNQQKPINGLDPFKEKGQAILYGPPGTGKTFVAEHLAKLLLSEGDGCSDLVQFHPAYSYEDFIQGIRPITKPDGSIAYSLLPGRFLEFCNNAKKRTGNCVLIIDEINRANLSRVFGELMYLLEYRNKTIPLAGGGSFEIPKNVFIIGTMNTADRSIALVDHALRRRFSFLQLQPKFDILRKFHESNGFDCEGLIQMLSQVNRQIGDKHYEIGISFFMIKALDTELEDIWTMEIEPYLEEYFADQPEKIRDFRWDAIKDKILS
jgi:5-methylcytosine-specific restriction protein B